VQAGEFKRCERVGMVSVEVGSTEKTPGMLRLAVPVRVPHNPLVTCTLHRIHRVMSLRPRDRDLLVHHMAGCMGRGIPRGR